MCGGDAFGSVALFQIKISSSPYESIAWSTILAKIKNIKSYLLTLLLIENKNV